MVKDCAQTEELKQRYGSLTLLTFIINSGLIAKVKRNFYANAHSTLDYYMHI